MSLGPKRNIPGEVLPALIAVFPKAFFTWKANPKPLKIGIHVDLKEQLPLLGKEKIKLTLYRYTSTIRYRRCLVEDVDRVDLSGEPCGKVTKFAQDQAQAKLAEHFAKSKPQKKIAA